MSRATAQALRIDAAAHAMADPTRRGLLRLVRDDEVAAGELARHFPQVSRPAVSQHLRVLERADLVTRATRRQPPPLPRHPDGLGELRDFIDDMWTDRLARLKHAAERAHAKERA